MALSDQARYRINVAMAAPGIGDEVADAIDNAAIATDINLLDNVDVALGTGSDALIRWSTGDASNHSTVFALGDSNQALHVTDKAAVATDWNVSADTHPTIYVHSNTTPATDYVKVGAHDGTTGHIEAVGGTLNLTGVGSVSVNEAGADVDFRIEGDNNTNLCNFDAGLYTGVGAVGIGSAAVNTATLTVDPPAMTAVANVDYAKLRLDNTAAVTVPAGTTAVVASLHVGEPNITATGTVTDAASVYIEAAPTEGGTGNYALWVDAGNVRMDGNVVIGAAVVPTNPQAILAILPQANASGVTANQSYFHGQLLPSGAVTIPTGTAPVVASLNIHEPNITATGTVTAAATVRIVDAPTEGSSNYALWVDAGVTRFDGNIDLAVDAIDIILGSTTGTKIGTATSQKLGFYNATPVVQGAALTTQLTSITHTAPTPDYAIQDLTQTTPYGFVTLDEGNTVLSVILNLQTRLAEVEARLEATGLIAAN